MKRVDPDEIKRQRTLGWPDFHPEDYCHICGCENPSWFAESETWRTATAAWAKETGREGICCPTCFVRMYVEATGKDPIWRLAPW